MRFTIREVAQPKRLSDHVKDMLNAIDLEIFNCDDPYEKKGCYWWVAYHKGMPAGFAGLKLHKPENAGFLCRAGVLTRYRGHGLQRSFIKVRTQKANLIGLDSLITYVSYDNVISGNNLIKCGFKLYMPEYLWGVENALYFYKDL